MDEIISSVAMGLGLVQLYHQVRKIEEIDPEMKNTILLGLLTSCLWLVYQYRKYGLNATTLYTSAGLIVQLYILNKILLKEKPRE
ncbi:hypothetical protein MpV1_045c [Micromonas sp. RCC1109 virus MpV1]|jgi:hypothetical protein|uniref:hypothetical protein n=1 Tax=Micromonas sp. RCC1109 virus MpV1 TaxID=880161 RepID=UPI0001EF4449|nr:hypothetical protein MpV1_045c [Micromonas sp. RCC1109 virus MpV1]ADQ90968.1 hypothetical protein MpV1_045c [Micromonas sp. RCC1109 virus MpV1]